MFESLRGQIFLYLMRNTSPVLDDKYLKKIFILYIQIYTIRNGMTNFAEIFIQ